MHAFHKQQRYCISVPSQILEALILLESYFFFLWHFMENTCSGQQVMDMIFKIEKILNMSKLIESWEQVQLKKFWFIIQSCSWKES